MKEKPVESLIISPREKWDEFLIYRKEHPMEHFSLLDERMVEGMFENQHDARAIRFLLSKGLSLEKSEDVLSSLRYFHSRHGEDAKLSELSSLYEELLSKGLLYTNVAPERSFIGKNIRIHGYLNLKRIKKCLSKVPGVSYEVDAPTPAKLPDLKVFQDPYRELHYIFNRIASLLDGGVSPDSVFLANVDDGYSYILPLMAKAYGFAIAPFSKRRVADLPIGQRFLALFKELNLEEALVKLGESFDRDPNYEALSRRMRELLVEGFDKEKQTATYLDALKSMSEWHREMNNAIHILDGEAAPNNSHVFFLNFSLGKAPHLVKDDGYLSDRELSLVGGFTSGERNEEASDKLRALIMSGQVEMLSRTIHSFEGETFDSPLADEVFTNGEKIKVEVNPTLDYEYSKAFENFELAHLLDIRNDYLIDSPKISYLESKGLGKAYPWNGFDPAFKPFDAGQKERKLSHSYSAIDTYYQCPFSYYLSRILKIDDSESTFSARLGTIAHRMFELSYGPEKLEFEEAYSRALEEERANGDFDAKEEFFIKRTKPLLEAAFAYQKELTDQTENAAYLTEFKIDVPLSDKAKLIGSIDRATVFGPNSDKLVITDYKTGDFHFDESLVENGLGLQLPVYSFAAHRMNELKDKDIVGLFISRILPSSAIHDQKKVEAYLGNVFALNGIFRNDMAALSSFSGPFLDHIKGTKVKKDGTFQYETSVREKETFERISEMAEAKLLEADKAIRSSSFAISPVKATGSKSSSSIDACDYCAFRDCCYRKDDVYRVIHKKDAKTEIEEEGKEEKDE